jgi:hypothetical protein
MVARSEIELRLAAGHAECPPTWTTLSGWAGIQR